MAWWCPARRRKLLSAFLTPSTRAAPRCRENPLQRADEVAAIQGCFKEPKGCSDPFHIYSVAVRSDNGGHVIEVLDDVRRETGGAVENGRLRPEEVPAEAQCAERLLDVSQQLNER